MLHGSIRRKRFLFPIVHTPLARHHNPPPLRKLHDAKTQGRESLRTKRKRTGFPMKDVAFLSPEVKGLAHATFGVVFWDKDTPTASSPSQERKHAFSFCCQNSTDERIVPVLFLFREGGKEESRACFAVFVYCLSRLSTARL
mmetsp:Transcript_6739/g.15390  ORF Transcript_6739/g.15390 Transcript_6739/m.15390 type:complete len:142 (+) Transcript_6739:124-549(+)